MEEKEEKEAILIEIQQIKKMLIAECADLSDKAAERSYVYGRIDPISDFQLLSIIEKGVDTLVAEKISRSFSFSQKEVSVILHMSDRSYRNHLKSQKPFTGLEAEMLVQLLNLMIEGVHTFDSMNDFHTWMGLNLEALNYKRPIEYLTSISGTKYITEFLKTIQIGAFA